MGEDRRAPHYQPFPAAHWRHLPPPLRVPAEPDPDREQQSTSTAAARFGLVLGLVFLLPLFLVLGASYAFVDGSQRAMVVDLTPPDRRGTSLGAYHALIGAAKLPSGILAGVLYASIAPVAAFGLGGVLATLAAVSFVLVVRPTASR